ncbi:MAG: hypothetical protein LBU51_03715 [Bacteroidales bacterium]|jgi:hypothetical protein|nr:hypothetical protein [Bacteroidales bacterium]
MKNRISFWAFLGLMVCFSTVFAQDKSDETPISYEQYEQLMSRIHELENKINKPDSVHQKKIKKGILEIGGYGEAVMHRFFYSDNFNRFYYPDQYKNVKSRGQFDLPHVVFLVSYDFGKGWKVSSEIEYEHGGTGSAIEIEADEFGEYEHEIERGGEVVLEQFWIQKTFNKAVNIRAGHIIIPFGITNAHHLPTEFFSVLRQEEESQIFPCTWHETGISFFGRKNNWNYEAVFVAGLDADMFNDANWIKGGGTSPYEFKLANAFAGAFRIDNYSVKGLRIGLSGYYGHSASNSLKADRYKGLQGAVILGSIDLNYKNYNLWMAANVDYGHLTDSKAISKINKALPKNSPSPRTNIASDALCYAVNVGYDFFGLSEKLSAKNMKFYLFGHYGFVNSMLKTEEGILADKRFGKHLISGGINFYPIKEIVVKVEYGTRLFASSVYNSENTFSIGICFSGMFTRNFDKN